MNPHELRETWLRFWDERGHKRIPGAPIIPQSASKATPHSDVATKTPAPAQDASPLASRLLDARKKRKS